MRQNKWLRVASGTMVVALGVGSLRAQGLLAIVDGLSSGEQFGRAAASVGDLDGDGVADFVVGAPRVSTAVSSPWVGRIRAYSGKDQQLLFERTGVATLDEFGFAVAALGDVNMDGVPDLGVGAPFNDSAAPDGGMVRIFSGSGAQLREHFGAISQRNLGYSLAGVGDLQGDGFADYVVGSPGSGNTARVYSGADGVALQDLTGNVLGLYGNSVAGGGDADGDGTPDILIGAPLDSNTGAVRLYSGKTFSLLRTFTGSNIGWAVTFLGDVDGDGKAEVVASGGSLPLTGQATVPFRVRIYSGATGTLLKTLNADGGVSNDDIGFALAAIGDIDGDAIPDLAVGAPNYGSPAVQAGSVRGFSGQSWSPLFAINPGAAGDAYGYAIAAAGDINQDGIPDLLTGRPLFDNAVGSDVGQLRVYSPVVVPIEPLPIRLGDKVLGTTSVAHPAHLLAFDALQSSVMTLKLSTSGTALVPKVTLEDAAHNPIKAWLFPAVSKKVTQTFVFQAHGSYFLRVEGADAGVGSYTLKTKCQVGLFAVDKKQKLTGMSTYALPFDVLPGAFVTIKVSPKGGVTPFDVMVLDPTGAVVDLGSHLVLKASGAKQISVLPLTQLGRHTLQISGVDPSRQLTVKVDLTQPKGKATISWSG